MLLGAPLAATPAPQDEQAGERSDQERGQQALEEARQHMDAGRWSKAAEAYAEALRYLPGNEEAVTGFREAQTLLDRGSTIEDVARTTQVLREQARVEFDNAMTRSRELLDQGDFDDAFQQALTAQIKLRQSRNLFPASEFTHRNQQAESRLSEIEQARENARLLEAQQREKEATRTQAVAQEKELERKASEIREFIRQVRRLQQAQKYEEALQVIDRILFLDEQNPTALMLKDLMESMKLYQRYAEVQRRKEIGYSRDLLKGQERMVLPRANRSGPGPKGVSDLMIYPEDWPSLSVMRTGQGGFVDSAQDRAVSQVLNHNAVPIDFTNNTFEQVMNFFQQVSGVNFYVDWKALDQIGVNREDEVSLQLEAVPVGAALDRVLDQLGDDVDRPQYAVVDGILTVSSEEALRRRVSTVVYDIRDLLFEVPYFDNAPDLDLDTALTQGNFGGGQGGGGGGQGGGGGGGFGGGGGGGGGGSGGGGGGGSLFGNPDDDPDRLSRAELVDQIVNIIQDNIDPEGWRDLGGDTGSLQEFNGNLIITNTPRNHRLINGLLAQLREIRALQINIETRVLTVSTDWFEQIGVDLDLFFNTNGTVRGQQLAVDPLGSLSDFFNADGTLKDPVIFGSPGQLNQDNDGDGMPDPGSPNTVPFGSFVATPTGTFSNNFANVQFTGGPIGSSPIRTTQGFTPIGVSQQSIDLLDAIGSTTEFGSSILSASPALVTGFQFLDDVQVDLLIEATQADRRSMVLSAPRLTFFNGQRAWIAVTTQTAFISGLTPIVGDSVGAFQPIVSTVSEGFVLDLEAVITADRRYVTINVNFDQATLEGFRETSALQGAAGGGGFGGGGGGGQVATFSANIDLPILNGSFIRTTVCVPDKGTVMLGGQRQITEFETEAGVPVLSKIPIVNRFFTNRITSKEERTLLMLIRPEIIIKQENEDILFPGLSDRLGGAGSYLR